ncbi:hypothetical protein B4Q13_22610, partial [Lacticaseibacillus rhamnosus]
IAALLSKRSYGDRAVRVERELPFAVRREGAILQGKIDRMVLIYEGDGVRKIEIVDFKTEALAEHSEPQLAQRASRPVTHSGS